jgi:hypothetical protein
VRKFETIATLRIALAAAVPFCCVLFASAFWTCSGSSEDGLPSTAPDGSLDAPGAKGSEIQDGTFVLDAASDSDFGRDSSMSSEPDGVDDAGPTADVGAATTCEPPCDTECQDCSPDGTCGFKPGYECCTDADCTRLPLLSCAYGSCVEDGVCAPCETDLDCSMCGWSIPGVCVESTCRPVECRTDVDCDLLCGVPGGMCTESLVCTCP